MCWSRSPFTVHCLPFTASALAAALRSFAAGLEHAAAQVVLSEALPVRPVVVHPVLTASFVVGPILVHPGLVPPSSHPLAVETGASGVGLVTRGAALRVELRAGLTEGIGIARLRRGGGGTQERYGGQHEYPSHAGHGLLPQLAPRWS
ncbi:MAG TPA: hypothetical protein VF046_16860 [Gemmatimonadales bacterium]